jgi:pantoate kinase
MTVMRSKAFAPGHVSGFFQICRNPKNLEKYGSRGAGLCLTKGATSAVEIKESDNQCINVFINEKESTAEVTKQAIKNLLNTNASCGKKIGQGSTKTALSDKKYNITINTTLELPVSQGFGMSAAGALSAALATASALEFKPPKNEAARSTHKAEIVCGTGLGDVAAEALGGVVIRREPGIPPHGILESMENHSDVVLCVVGEEIPTKDIIRNKKHIERINKSGGRCIEELLEKPTITNLFDLAYRFTLETKLVSRSVLRAIEDVRKYGLASACMLGNSVFAVGNDIDRITSILEEYGETYQCEIDNIGTRVLQL